MSTLPKKALRIGIRVILWVVAICGCVIAAGALTDLYMILIGGARPGDIIYLDEIAPTAFQAWMALLCGFLVIALAALTPSIARLLWRQLRGGENVS